MHIYFSAIGGTGIGPLALIAKEAGFQVSGSDKQDSQYIHYLNERGITTHIGQDRESIEKIHEETPIDWLVYSSAVTMENPNSEELQFCKEKGIKHTKRDEFLSFFLEEKNLKLIAIAGTHGKTTTTAMAIWLMKQVGIPVSYSVGAKISFGHMGHFDPNSEYFVYEADEFDHNFLSFHPHISLISGVDYDHPDIYPTREEYEQAFRDYIGQSEHTVLWKSDLERLQLPASEQLSVMEDSDATLNKLSLVGEVVRKDALLVIRALQRISDDSVETLTGHMNSFPGLSRRFEQIATNIYSDYAHTPEKIRGALQIAKEVAGENVVVIYEGLHNTRQHFIKKDLEHLFDNVKKLYIVPSYLAREDKNLPLLSPSDLAAMTSQPEKAVASQLDDTLRTHIEDHANNGDLVLCLSAGGGGSLDEWLREVFAK